MLHFCRKTRILLETFETVEDTARAYDEAARLINNGIAAGTDNGKGVVSVVEKRPLLSVQETEANWVVKKAKVETTQQFKPLEEDHIEQMIKELLHYSSIELFNFNV
ncbi:hypothetical protein Golax_001399 [Gossypium laxum]|uniref:AP2/ERF domain-containing protein n=1 Tax=Gossypium laxum TaxID=34288 RepID=A0A7J9AWX6_9ROSI|nr:hypothetical protein [Gossypium laxum]